jgi:hypothetical protein
MTAFTTAKGFTFNLDDIVNELLEEAEVLEFTGYTLGAETIRKFLRIATPIEVMGLEEFV